jgi:hypothetical protein
MSKSEAAAGEVRLLVKAASPAVAITVVDANFAKVAEGGGRLEVELPVGIYSVTFQAGESVRQQPVLLPPGAIDVELEQEAIDVMSSVPLATANIREANHERAARKLSQEPHRKIGGGGELLVFVRDVDRRTRTIPTRGLTLHSADGEQVADLEEEANQSRGEGTRWAGEVFELDPGTYRLRSSGGDFGGIEQALYVAPEWQTQIFLERRPEPVARRGRRADLAEGSVLMARSGFDPSRVDTSTTELARQALRDRTLRVPDAILHEMLDSKCEDPMLGIYGGHLMLMSDDPDREVLEAVVENLRGLVSGHPDVDALALAIDHNAPVGTDFSLPPMLWSSWSRVVGASALRRDLMPPGSLSETIAERVIGGGTWLLWQVPQHPRREEAQVQRMPDRDLAAAVVELAGTIAELARTAPRRELPGSLASAPDEDVDRIAEDVVGYATVLAAHALQQDVPIADLVVDDAAVVEALDVPRSAAEQAIGVVFDQLGL